MMMVTAPAKGDRADAHNGELERTSYDSVGRAFKLPDFNLDVSHRAHVGYYLFEQGRPQLEKSIGYQPRGVEGLRRGMTAPSHLGLSRGDWPADRLDHRRIRCVRPRRGRARRAPAAVASRRSLVGADPCAHLGC